MPQLTHPMTVTFLDPDPTGSVYEFDSIRCAPGRPRTETVRIESPADVYSVSGHGSRQSLPIAIGWEAIISTSAGEILVDSHVSRIHHGSSASFYTIQR